MTWWQGNDGSNDEGPWGKKRPNAQSSKTPDLEDLLKKGQDNFKKMMPPTERPVRLFLSIAVAVVGVWMASGFYQIKEGQQGAVLRFGKWVKTTTPGINYHLPYPFEQVIVVNVDQLKQLGNEMPLRLDPVESPDNLMLTGDENIVSVNFTVQWYIKDVGKYLFRIRDPDTTVKQAAESAVREILAQVPIAFALTKGRGEISDRTRALLQHMLDQYEGGIQIHQIQLKSVDPPQQVVDSFRDVQRARADAESRINEAKAYYNSVVPVARGEAAKLLQAAEGYRQAIVDKAKGETARFLALLHIYKLAPEVTKKRLFLETMESILEEAPKVIIDNKGQSSAGVTPFLPLPQLMQGVTPTPSKNDEGANR